MKSLILVMISHCISNSVAIWWGMFLISLVDWGGERALFPTTAANCCVLFMVPAEYSDHCVLLQSINTLKFNGAFHNSQKLETMALHKL